MIQKEYKKSHQLKFQEIPRQRTLEETKVDAFGKKAHQTNLETKMLVSYEKIGNKRSRQEKDNQV